MPGLKLSGAWASAVSLNSFDFLLIAAVAIVMSALIGGLWARTIALLGLNVFFFLEFAANLPSVAILLVFLVITYFLGAGQKRLGLRWSIAAQMITIGGLWVFLFMVRDGNLFGPVNPFHYLPVQIIGISYMVFRVISYLMEVEFIESPSFLRFCVYVLFFPALLAGPIERYRSFERQLAAPNFDAADVMPSLHRIANGLIKKFVIADNLAPFGVFSFTNASEMSPEMLWIGALSQLGLIYLDFSGYCDIVIGVSRLMGFQLIENFNRPFSSTSIQEFWNRWHISLSSLVRDYIFTPINMAIIKGTPRHVQFTLITGVYFCSMILIGLWHGTTWGFVVFGTIHGGALVGAQLMRKFRKAKPVTAWYAVRARQVLVYSFVSVSLILWLKSTSEWGPIFGRMTGLR